MGLPSSGQDVGRGPLGHYSEAGDGPSHVTRYNTAPEICAQRLFQIQRCDHDFIVIESMAYSLYNKTPFL